MTSKHIDLNSDLGESYGAWKMGNDEQILGIVSSANIACGFHAGDPLNILRTLKQAVKHDVCVVRMFRIQIWLVLVAVIWIYLMMNYTQTCFIKSQLCRVSSSRWNESNLCQTTWCLI
jgi:hypothetical protein